MLLLVMYFSFFFFKKKNKFEDFNVLFLPSFLSGEICGFRVHNGPSGSGSVQFEAVVLDRSTGEGLVRSKEPLDCESQREHSFTIQAYDCGEGPDGVNSKKSHKLVHSRHYAEDIYRLNNNYSPPYCVLRALPRRFCFLLLK